jgi:integrase
MATIRRHWPPPYKLVGKRWYGCGLRVSACVPLRVQCFTVAAGVFTLHDGQGGQDRTVPRPDTRLPDLRAPLEAVPELHHRGLERNSAGVFLVHAFESKDTQAAKECIWPWCFPAKQLTSVPKTEA